MTEAQKAALSIWAENNPSIEVIDLTHSVEAQFAGKRDREWKLKAPGAGSGGAYAHSKAWITPDGDPIMLGGQLHHEWMNENPDTRGRYRIPEAADISEAVKTQRAALKAGFARVTYGVSNGVLTVEARKRDWPVIGPAVQKLAEANIGKIDEMTVHLFNNAVDRVVDADTRQLFRFSDRKKLENLPMLSGPGGVTEMSAQGSSAQFQGKMFPDPQFDSELKKIRAGESGGQTFTPAGTVWSPADAKVDLVSLASKNIPLGKLTPEAVADALRQYADLLDEPGIVAGVFAFSKDGKPTVSLDINAVIPKKYRANTVEFARDNDQVAVWDVEHSKEVPAGGKGDTRLQSPGEIMDALNFLHKGKPVDVEEIIRENRISPPMEEELMLPGIGGKKALPPATVANMTKADIAAHFPESVTPRSRFDAIPSEITGSPLFKQTSNPEEAFARKLVEFAKEWQDHPSYQSGLRWYSEFTPKLKAVFGKDAPVMAELLAGTSPQQPPTSNYAMALDALEGFRKGRFDKQVKKFEEGLDKLKDGSWRKWLDREIKSGRLEGAPETPTAETYINHWVAKHSLLPRQSNGKLYSISSDAVLKILARRWLGNTAGLKTQNFVRNLLGIGTEATIDLWADRTMRRVGYAGHKERWRILPKNATGVADEDFMFSQRAFRKAAEELGVEPHELQGALWFAEKQLWADNGWSRLDLGDFRKEIIKTDMLKQGIEQRAATFKAQQKAKTAEQPDLLPLVEPKPTK
jgi:hypothetical protein